MSKQQNNIVSQIETITADLLAVKKKIVLLGDMAALTSVQRADVESLLRGLDGMRAWELGHLRQSLGLDQDLVKLNKGLRR